MANTEKRPILSEPGPMAPPPAYNPQYNPPQYGGRPEQMKSVPSPVVVNQPEFGTPQGRMVCALHGQRQWSSGLCDCSDDATNCVMVWCCHLCVACQLSSRLNESACLPLCVPGSMIALRARLRTLGGIQGSICDDCITMSFCGLCGLCQMKREMDHMGFV